MPELPAKRELDAAHIEKVSRQKAKDLRLKDLLRRRPEIAAEFAKADRLKSKLAASEDTVRSCKARIAELESQAAVSSARIAELETAPVTSKKKQ